ncbi:hypothetical protein L486_01473 [Kwoniella mangroviensis CBS 10435]|uniref:Small ribosomal subunit protein mS33 n=1 Tax=Kwoniella mangroviensis CBS 10435 TaxID=1331196 RepID=A0A1B9J1Z7_9TREE|nr:uncharacterized protein I203_03861 [Kwoniella mangroviensis CBS 8507]OCF61811.1 hypothetical protein L486_01473 [Kwoniella mangroviensis CBS 10435]OCF67175.1 hypothetical protein I203_03861 [Kwoniella mangroviensis CBS 8507]OCF77829.1 hypothetical protein I204_01831 [Kwoniella mangroviensis CBS 8886]
MAPNLHNLLSSLRSPIFQTLSNPTSSRMGTKYLRRRLRGPSIASYYPQLTNPFPSISALNRTHPSNPFAGWQGNPLPSSLTTTNSGKVIMENPVWKNEGNMLRNSELVDEGFEEVTRKRGLGWLADGNEVKRAERVRMRKAAGKGPPKKGQGRRSQMKKK